MSRETCSTCKHHVIGMPIDDLEPDHPCQQCLSYDNWSPASTALPETETETEKTLADHIRNKARNVAGGPAHVLAGYSVEELSPAAGGSSKARLRQVGGDHYKEMGVEPWDVIDTWPYEQRIGAYRAGALKYLMRLGAKDAGEQEAAKAHHYLEKLLEVMRAGR